MDKYLRQFLDSATRGLALTCLISHWLDPTAHTDTYGVVC